MNRRPRQLHLTPAEFRHDLTVRTVEQRKEPDRLGQVDFPGAAGGIADDQNVGEQSQPRLVAATKDEDQAASGAT